ncbi:MULTISPECIES: AAA domain-containing protein [Caulobacter]|jgi:primosomal replication protein N''|uniref:AAA domain-containing protein n=1 Tax=Caulobacter TaxID=75 RepID=UPI000BB47164|nr:MULTISPECIES: AAA domain-containing protein [Caulobacter]ATC24350.1 DUF4011 domain-containing protein [Caulobacter vibrioides]MBQ1562452.1 DUF4011 domain-containing protein [Caulobacter sp.]
MIKFCPSCHSERPASEFFCEGGLEGGQECGWDLSNAPLRPAGWRPTDTAAPPPVQVQTLCQNGHGLDPGDLICPVCGADPVEELGGTGAAGHAAEALAADAEDAVVREVDAIHDWILERRFSQSAARERFIGRREGDDRQAVVTLYTAGYEPDPEVQDLLRTLPRDHVPEIIETGHWEGRAYEVTEDLQGGTLADLGLLRDDVDTLSTVLLEVGGALHSLHEHGLRHRDIRPSALLVRSREPLDLVVTSFGSARLSEFDLDVVSPLETSRYMAPEALAGGVAAASDWWSLGMVLLEQVTRGACFAGADDQSFLIQVLTNGAPIPEGLDPRVEGLLRGLLARDRHERWGWPQTQLWLAGETPPAPISSLPSGHTAGRRALALGRKSYAAPTEFALAAAQANVWDEARGLLIGGALATWAQDADLDPALQAELRNLANLDGASEDLRLGLALKALNPAMPLICRGEIVTPGWLLDNPEAGYALISGPAPELLQRKGAEPWLHQLRVRAGAVREKARQMDVVLSEPELEIHLLSTSRAHLAAQWAERRRVLPDTDHPGLVAILERRQTTDEDFILLLSADVGQFRTADAILAEAAEHARRAGLDSFDPDQAAAWLDHPRREVYAEIESRLEGFARCGVERLDDWADQFRLERRLPIAKALALLGLPWDVWVAPPKQAYVSTILDFFSRRLTGGVMRGPLSRMVVGKTGAKLDLVELGSERRTAAGLLDHLLLRNEQPIDIDPEVLTNDPKLERRLRLLHSHATLYRRDTGIDGLYLGFPFLLLQEAKPNVKPRIAPVLLWPVKVQPELGARGRISLTFDRDREEVRLNPALDAILGPDAARRWDEAARELLGRASLSAADVMDGLGELARSIGARTLTALPNKDVKLAQGQDQLICSGVLFHLAYLGQAVMEDLRHLKGIPPVGSALETVLRIGDPPERATPPHPPELDRYFTAASDPSQEMAVLEAREGAGLLVEGPPGTGKSQTIVNMVSDAIGRGRSLLIVCQKQAALEVVRKRLDAEGLGERMVMINDVNKDRRAVLTAVRTQLEELWGQGPGSGLWRLQRPQIAARIEAHERDLNAHHGALHADDQATGLSYRLIVGDLIGYDAGPRPAVSAPGLRSVVADLNAGAVASLEEACGPLARLWLPARYEGNPLAATTAFSPDEETIKAFEADFTAFLQNEGARQTVLERTVGALAMDDPAPFQAWMGQHAASLRALSPAEREAVQRWSPRLRPDVDARSALDLGELDAITEGLAALPTRDLAPPLVAVAVTLSDHELSELLDLLEALDQPAGFWARLSPARWSRQRRLKAFLRRHALEPTLRPLETIRAEKDLRPWRRRLEAIHRALVEPDAGIGALARPDLLDLAKGLRGRVANTADHLRRVVAHPAADLAFHVVEQGSLDALEGFFDQHERAYARHEARGLSLGALANLAPWFEPAWLEARSNAIAANEGNGQAIAAIASVLDVTAAYQRFRPRALLLEAQALAVFAVLRGSASAFEALALKDLDDEIRRTIGREARLAWKARLETRHPTLLLEAAELNSKINALRLADGEMRRLNGRLLIEGVNMDRIGQPKDWEAITRLTGIRARRLREFIDQGADLGLMALRPIWLMNPDVASRVLPLKKALFDTVIYDEASQMPVEYALPSLFRSGKLIVSGDEKQMPPTNFFNSKVENDEAGLYEGEEADDDADEEAREEVAETWNRREIKDCPDLLALAKTVLPATTLQIHYRSIYRELVEFSNAAFYGKRLSVPARHPDAEIKRVRPITLIRTDGVYEDQVNEAEARRVVDILAKVWKREPHARRSIGVVSFNRKQADLIDEMIETRAETDLEFRQALAQERDRVEGGEDMGFFVKNVENVQGDERDVIIFSSTFGRNAQGTFRRNFGVLGQGGGERRLNVAVTRAREAVVMVTSMPIAEISDFLGTRRAAQTPRDFLQAYLEYARMMSSGELDNARGLLGRLTERPDERRGAMASDLDGFEAAVAEYVTSLGWTPHRVRDSGAFGLDFALENPKTGLYGLGIECDAPRHALLAGARARELWRPSVLGRSIGQVHRVSCQGWLRAPDREKARLREAIALSLGERGAA